MVVALIICSLIGVCVWAGWVDNRDRKRQIAETKASDAKWLAEEKAKPRCRVVVKLRGKTKSLKSEFYEPDVDQFWGIYLTTFRRSSFEAAENVACRIARGEHYRHSKNEFYLHQEIESAIIETEKK